MIVHPRIGQRVRLHYATRKRAVAPHHGKVGRVVIVARGPGPRNHLIELDDGGGVLVVPCGQLMRFDHPVEN